MEIQVKDKIFFSNNTYIKGEVEILKGNDKLLQLESFNEIKDDIIPDCQRCYTVKYTILDNLLTLYEVTSNCDISMITNNAIKLTQNNIRDSCFEFNKFNTKPKSNSLFKNKYSDINLPIIFTGALLLVYKKNHKHIICKYDNIKYWINKYKHLIKINLNKGEITKIEFLDKEDLYKNKLY